MQTIKNFLARYERDIFSLIITLVIAFLVFTVVVNIAEVQCIEKTKFIGFNNSWSLMGGCQIEILPGKWIPLDSYYFGQD